jgi:hypothetical protein
MWWQKRPLIYKKKLTFILPEKVEPLLGKLRTAKDKQPWTIFAKWNSQLIV